MGSPQLRMGTRRMEVLPGFGMLAAIVCLLSAAPVCPADLQVYGGPAVRLPLGDIAKAYEQKTGVKVNVTIAPPKELVARMAEARTGDVFVPGSYWAMGLARSRGVVAKGEGKTVAHLVPCIGVRKGNPLGIHTLADLARPGVRVAIRSDAPGPERPCLGEIAAHAFVSAGIADKVRPNIVARPDECNQVVATLRSGNADAVICWSFFAAMFPREIEAVPLPEALAKPRPIPAAVTTCAADPAAARAFAAFLHSSAAQRIFTKRGYRAMASRHGQAQDRPGVSVARGTVTMGR